MDLNSELSEGQAWRLGRVIAESVALVTSEVHDP